MGIFSGATTLLLSFLPLFPLAVNSLTHCILVDSSTVTCWTRPFTVLRVSGQL